MLQLRKVPMEFQLLHVTVSWGVWFTGLILEQCRHRNRLLCGGDTAQCPSLLLVPKKQGMFFLVFFYQHSYFIKHDSLAETQNISDAHISSANPILLFL